MSKTHHGPMSRPKPMISYTGRGPGNVPPSLPATQEDTDTPPPRDDTEADQTNETTPDPEEG